MCCTTVWQLVYGDMFQRVWSFLSSASNPPVTSNYKQVSPSLYQLYPDKSNSEADTPTPEIPKVDIIFFHGLQTWDYVDAYWKTWTSKLPGGDPHEMVAICWPKEWLGPDLENARIFSASYDSRMIRSRRVGVQDLPIMGESLIEDIIMTNENIGQSCPVILVGHNLGGIMIKMFILSAVEKSKLESESLKSSGASNAEEGTSNAIFNFLKNLKGVFYYSTPHGGSELANLVDYLVLNPFVSPVLNFLKVLNDKTRELNDQFQTWRRSKNVKTFTVGEGFPTVKRGWDLGIVVPEGSARFDTDLLTYYTAQADHFKVCKPSSRLDSTYRKLLEFIAGCVPEANKRRCSSGSEVGSASSPTGSSTRVEMNRPTVVTGELRKRKSTTD